MFCGILYILKTGCPWYMIPEKYGSHTTIYGTFVIWKENKIFEKFFNELKEKYEKTGKIIFPLVIDGSHSKSPRSKFGGKSPVDRSKNGVKTIAIVDQNKVPLSIKSGSGNNHDSIFFKNTLDALNIDSKDFIMLGDAAFDVEDLKKYSKENNIELITNYNKRRNKTNENDKIINPIIKKRVVVEHFFSWMHSFRGIKTCWCFLQDSFDAFLQLAASVKIINFF